MTDPTAHDLPGLAAQHSRSVPAMPQPSRARGLWQRLVLLLLVPAAVGALTFGLSFLITPTYTARVSFLPPQQSQSGSAAALASLGSLAGLVGAGGARSSGEQYLALMQSYSVSDRLIDQYKLVQAYDLEYRADTRKSLAKNVRMSLGKKDGLITIEVDDEVPQRAADMANSYVVELRRITSMLAVTEAQQRRVFFESQLQRSRDQLVKAQQELQASGFNPGALKVEPRAAAESYARLKAEATAAEVRLQIMRGTLTDNAPEVRQLMSALAALRGQLARAEQANTSAGDGDYVSRYREFKYQETLFELYARQFELARVDESREGNLIQVVDEAAAPEKSSKPRRVMMAATAALLSLGLMVLYFLFKKASPRSGRLSDAGSAG